MDLQSLDQELVSLQTQYESIKSHKQFEKKWQELKDYVSKLNKDISKKQTKMYKDKTAFTEGYAYHWYSASHNINKGRPGPRPTSNRAYSSREEDTESDSSVSSSFSRPPPLLPTMTHVHTNPGTRKRGYNGSHPATPHPKNHPDTTTNHTMCPPNHQRDIQRTNTLSNNPGSGQHLNHLGPLATQALQLLQVQPTDPLDPNLHCSNLGQSNAGHPPLRIIPNISLLSPSLVNAPVIPTKQSILDPHLAPSGSPNYKLSLGYKSCPIDVGSNIIYLTPHNFSQDDLELLHYGLSFCPTSQVDKYDTIKDLYLFSRKLTYKFLYDQDRICCKQDGELAESIKHFTMAEFRSFRDLILLLEENESLCSSNTGQDLVQPAPTKLPIPVRKFKPKSIKFPD